MNANERKRQILNKSEIKILVKYALLMDKTYGPQEIEWAVLRTGELIFQATRNANLQKFKKAPTKNYPIFPKNVKGELVPLLFEAKGRELKKHLNLTGKIVITDSLDIDFITDLTSQNKPAGIILTRGSLTAHAVTIIREAKIPSVLTKDLNFENKQSFSANKKYMVREWQEIIPLESANSHEPLISIAIPRGGSPMGTGLKEIFPLSSHFESNDGINRDATRSLLPTNFPRLPIDHVIIADTVIGTGTTIERTIEAIKNLASVRYFHVFTAVASQYGVKQLFQKYPLGLRVCAGCVETKFEWVIKDGKPVLFVAGIGDAGDLVSR